MIKKLNPKHGMDVWMNQQLVNEIEGAFKQALKTENLVYYYVVCSGNQQEEKTLKKQIKWMGAISLIDFMKKVQKLDASFCPMGVTNAQNKKQLLHYLEHDFYATDQHIPFWDYWIGDVVGTEMVCGDDLVIELWKRINEQKTKGSTTQKDFFR